MAREPWRLAVDALPVRHVRRAGMLFGLRAAGKNVVTVLDPGGDEFVSVPGVPEGSTTRALCLAPDGGGLFLAPRDGARLGGLCLHTLATGRQHWFDARAEGQDIEAALSPDGQAIATLTGTRQSEMIVTVLDIATGTRRRLWGTEGGSSQESTISWSPDGRWIAATYLTPDEEWATVVVDASDGTLVQSYASTRILPSANGAWTGDHELLIFGEETDYTLVDMETGADRTINGADAASLLAAIGVRLIVLTGGSPGNTDRITVAGHDDGAERTAVVVRPRADIDAFDIAPAALPAL